jgi:hypothetical protein
MDSPEPPDPFQDASQTEADIVRRALVEGWDQDRLFLALDEHHELRRP